jgi:hypothetical protein
VSNDKLTTRKNERRGIKERVCVCAGVGPKIIIHSCGEREREREREREKRITKKVKKKSLQ